MTSTPRSDRNVGYDILRTLACGMVLLLHASGQNWNLLSPNDPNWVAMHIYNASTASSVTLFFMLSGALFLNAPPPGRKLWTRNIPRLAVAYIVWSLLYGIDSMTLPGFFANPLGLINAALIGCYHLWFMPAMLGIYLLLPALYAIAHYDNGRAMKPFLIVFAIFGIAGGTVLAFDGVIPSEIIMLFAKINPALCGSCGYFLLGYALTKIDVSRLRRLPFVAVYLAALAITATAGILRARAIGAPASFLQADYTITTCAEAVALFLLFRTCRIAPDSRTAACFRALSACTLGIYLLHPFVMGLLNRFGINSVMLPAVLSVPLLAAVVGLICLGVVALLRRIPYVGKWIV